MPAAANDFAPVLRKAAARKPRPKPLRTLRVLGREARAVFVRIAVGRLSDDYVIEPVDCQLGGRGFSLSKVGAHEPYHVRLADDNRDDHCDCMGALAHGHCKHIDCLRAMAARDLI